MKPETIKPFITVQTGHVVTALATMNRNSVHVCVTSPPYFNLRDYGIEPTLWCDGWTGVLGQEKTVEGYVAHLAECARAIEGVLRDDGTFWLNLGDSYVDGELAGIPWLVAHALKADGWKVRSEIIWAKAASFGLFAGSSRSESAKDRPTRSHEHLLMFTKRRSKTYFYDIDAIRDPREDGGTGRNTRSVWTIAPGTARKVNHSAVFPPKLALPCILAGSSSAGACGDCGAPLARQVSSVEDDQSWKKLKGYRPRWDTTYKTERAATAIEKGEQGRPISAIFASSLRKRRVTTGWTPTCGHKVEPVPCVVLDPFCGSGSAGEAAVSVGRSFVGVDISEKSAKLSLARVAAALPREEIVE